MRITTRAICAGLFAVSFLGFVSAPTAMAARSVSAGDVVNGRYEEGLLGSVGTAGNPIGGQNKIPLTDSRKDSNPVQKVALWSTPAFFSNAVRNFAHLRAWMRPFVAEHLGFHLHRSREVAP